MSQPTTSTSSSLPPPPRKQSPTRASGVRLPKPLENANYQTKINLMFANHIMFNPMYCKTCSTNEHILEDRSEGNFVCTKCGCVISRLIDFENNDWRDFDEDKPSNSRVGNSTLEENEDVLIINESRVLGTRIKPDSSKLIKLGKMNIENEFLSEIFKQVTSIVVDQFKLESRYTFKIKELLKEIYSENRRTFNNKTRNQCLAACLFCGLKSEGIGKTLKEFCVILHVSKEEISKWVSIIQKNPKTKELIKTKDYNSPQAFVEDFCKKLHLPPSAISKIKDLVDKAIQSDLLSGKSPSTVAAACLFYFISTSTDQKVTSLQIGEQEIEGATSITSNTFKNALDSIITVFKKQ
ncbi:transcription initiation factor [Naegleria gruberi]|uniref:General transcription factor TFIIB n=1 Tax=Naegleria gruberi TaxID=5762 RepID=D2VJV9_NAEGR|nr:transcription initiation factor [Naegleria gruberi]EFC42837.1 transcription initiation factor [Naegleria gruberi]|eukprot:XP_002675581.1 transcription initiation factor [Naegleria gruberi strain NEG-M]